MSKQRNMIDFEIIWKKIHRIIADDEDKLLQNWIDENPKHRMFYKHAEGFYANGSQFSNNKQELKKAWKKVRQKTGGARQNFIRLATITSTAAASILLIISLYYLSNRNSFSDKLSENSTVIKPGTKKALLILSDGSQHDLSEGKDFVLKEGNSVLHSTGDKLEYTGSQKKRKEVKHNMLKIPRGGEYFLQLSDGTKVWLNSESSLRYPVQFSEEERTVELSGEAYFEVSKNEQAPFLVTSGVQVVKVLGTQFNISSYNESKFIFTTLVEGRVEVYEKGNPENNCLLKPNEQSVFSKKDIMFGNRKVDPFPYIAWKQGRFIFDDKSLDCIMETLSRWYNIQVVFVNADRKDIRFTANLQRYADIQEILSKIEKTEEVTFRINNNTITIE